MPPTQQVIKSCCGSVATLINAVKPIRVEHVDLFKTAGFKVNDIYVKNGLFYAKKDNLTISCALGLTKINVKCKLDCTETLKEVDIILTKIENM